MISRLSKTESGDTPDGARAGEYQNAAQSAVFTIGVEYAVKRAAEVLTAELPKNAAAAVLNVSSSNEEASVLAAEEFEFQLVKTTTSP